MLIVNIIRLKNGLNQNFANCNSLFKYIEVIFYSVTVIIEKGEIEGEFIQWWPNGNKRYQLNYEHGQLDGKQLVFLARHGNPHRIPPHKINYRANIWGLKQLGVTEIIAVAAVGGITEAMAPAQIAIPDQIIRQLHMQNCPLLCPVMKFYMMRL
jgi:hypothetical protein